MAKLIPRFIRDAYKNLLRKINRPNIPCDFSLGITEEELRCFAENAIKTIKGRHIEYSVEGPIVRGAVRSNSGITVWMFTVDFNDYGYVSGRYWLYSENNDSPIPKTIAKRMQLLIEKRLDEIRNENKTLSELRTADLPGEDVDFTGFGKESDKNLNELGYTEEHFCTNCGAILDEQEGFNPDRTTWICKKCGQQLVGDNLNSDVFGDVVWYCDECGSILNNQEGFTESDGSWTCTECSAISDVTVENIKKDNRFS